MSATSFLRLSSSTARSPCRVSFVSIRCCQSGNFLLRCNESLMVGLAVLILLLGGHQLLQNANDLAALWCVPLTGTARQERRQRGTIIIGNPVHRAFEPTATSTESNTSGYLTKRVMVLPFTRACFLTTLTFSVRFVFRHQNPSFTNYLHDLPQWFHEFCLIHLYTCKLATTTFEMELWGANRPQHMHMCSLIVCD